MQLYRMDVVKRIASTVLLGFVAFGAAPAAAEDACLKPFVSMAPDGKPLFHWHSKGGAGSVDIEASPSGLTCSPNGRIVLLSSPSDDAFGSGSAVFEITIIDPVEGSFLDTFAGWAWLSPDHRLIAFTPWYGAHGLASADLNGNMVDLLDVDADLKDIGGRAGEFSAYPGAKLSRQLNAEPPVGGAAYEAWSKLLDESPEIITQLHWDGSRDLWFFTRDRQVDDNGRSYLPSSRTKLVSVQIGLTTGLPPSVELTVRNDAQCAEGLPRDSASESEAAAIVCFKRMRARRPR